MPKGLWDPRGAPSHQGLPFGPCPSPSCPPEPLCGFSPVLGARDLRGPQGLPASVARGLSTGLPRPGWVPRGAAPSLPRPSVLWSGPSGPSLSPASSVSRCGERGPSDARGARPPPVTTAALMSVGRFHTCAVPCNPAAPARSSHLPGLWAGVNAHSLCRREWGSPWPFVELLFPLPVWLCRTPQPLGGRQRHPPRPGEGWSFLQISSSCKDTGTEFRAKPEPRAACPRPVLANI